MGEEEKENEGGLAGLTKKIVEIQARGNGENKAAIQEKVIEATKNANAFFKKVEGTDEEVVIKDGEFGITQNALEEAQIAPRPQVNGILRKGCEDGNFIRLLLPIQCGNGTTKHLYTYFDSTFLDDEPKEFLINVLKKQTPVRDTDFIIRENLGIPSKTEE